MQLFVTLQFNQDGVNVKIWNTCAGNVPAVLWRARSESVLSGEHQIIFKEVFSPQPLKNSGSVYRVSNDPGTKLYGVLTRRV